MSGGQDRSGTTVSTQVGDDGRVICHTYQRTTPILVLDAGAASVSVSIKGGREAMPAPAVAFARDLAACAQRFPDECERLHALHQKASGRPVRGQAPSRVAAAKTL